MVNSMQLKLASRSRKWISQLLLCGVFSLTLCLSAQPIPAQDQESGSTTVTTSEQPGMDLPDDPAAKEADSGEPEKEERPRELGVMILIVWLLAGAGIGILIFTSLFGHSVRSMIGRLYPNQMYPPKKAQPETPVETSTEAETGDEKTES